jgi:hypothetical protein
MGSIANFIPFLNKILHIFRLKYKIKKAPLNYLGGAKKEVYVEPTGYL